MASSNEKRVLAQAEGPYGTNILYDNPDAQELFVDGVGQMSMGTAVTKVKFFRVSLIEEISDENRTTPKIHETRNVCLSMVIPTQTLLEWIGNSMKSMDKNVDALEEASKVTISGLRNLMK